LQRQKEKPIQRHAGKKCPVFSFFSGCGAFDLGFASAGFTIKLALDLDPLAVKTYNHNNRNKVCHVADLSVLNGHNIIEKYIQRSVGDMPRGVIGGAPCQTFSSGNVHFRKDDARHMLPRHYARILRALNLKYDLDFFLFENVKGIKSIRHRKEYCTIKRLFSRAGFRLFEGELDAADFGVAQHRRRVFIVGFNKTKYPDVEFRYPAAITTTTLTVGSKLKGLPEPLFFRRGVTSTDIPYHPNHWTMYPRSLKFTNGSLTANHKRGRSFHVLDWEKPSRTVAYGNREVHIHPNAHRRLSVYEAMLLQGFPDDYEILGTLSDQIRQVSDAIPPQIGEALGNAIYAALYSGNK